MRKFLWVGLLVILLPFLALSCQPAGPSLPADTAGAVKIDTPPQIDGTIDSVWSKTKPITINVSGGANLPNGTSAVELRAVYTADTIYFLAQWQDATQSVRRSPWEKQADGSWKKLKDPNDKGGDNNVYYEDKMAFIWNINDSIAGFNTQGCMVTCHAGEAGKAFGNKYTANAGETGDIWHWKSIRTGTVGQIDDQYVDNTRYDAQKSPEAGRKSDPKTGGGYLDNQTDDKKLPKYALADNKPAPSYWILDNEKVAFDDSKYTAGNEVPGIIVAPFTGDRGDLTAKSAYKDGKYTLEWSRKLQTGSQYDVQFSDLTKTYYFGVSVFDNAQVRHAWSSGVNKLVFVQ
ncbi:MAG: ethylbenzene dehydrogenase [Chloroflexi bacterium]|nr:ethylbenzene dehydrogenase [Chloroflexota bacterium]MBI2980011.1 ethylbenzene dehydrogenase [Chloroflexota bacterium]